MKLKDGIPQIVEEELIYDDNDGDNDIVTRKEVSKLHDYWNREIDFLNFKFNAVIIGLFIIALLSLLGFHR